MFKIIFSPQLSCNAGLTAVEVDRGEIMPYPPGNRIAKREKIVQSARRLFNQHGFDNVSVKQIMAGAELTHGGFYSYFKAKSDLYTEALACFFTDPNWRNRWEGVEVDPTAGDVGPQVVRAYLSRQHFEDVENSCPMVALPTDARRKGRSTRIAFETVFQAMVGTLARSVSDKGRSGRAKAAAIAALCVGGMVVARAMHNDAAADDLRVACTSVALELGGWHRTAGRNGASKAQRPLRAARA
jgi:TetR/AcrR family transcriptional repressor of nem operon